MDFDNLIAKTKSLLLGGEASGDITLSIRLAALRFHGKRGDYYMFLADLMEGTEGKRSLMDIFLADAKRYGAEPRGELSAHWAKRFDAGGGSLSYTFDSTLPAGEVAAMDTLLQSGGERSLELALKDLAKNTELTKKALWIIIATCISSFITMLVTLVFIFTFPTYIVPKLMGAFSILPYEEYPPSAKSLLSYSEFVLSYWLAITGGVFALVAACFWSLPNLVGPVRIFFDKYGIIWGIHRDFESIRFLSSISTMLNRDESTDIVLKDALEMQRKGASRWRKYHLEKMLVNVKSGQIGPLVFSTGFLEKSMDWFLADLIEANGLEDALKQVRSRLSENILKRISTQSVIISWIIIFASILISSYLLIWQTVVLDDMRRALQIYVS